MAYNVYVSRRGISETEDLRAFVIEGEGKRLQCVERHRRNEFPRLGYLHTFLWAVRMVNYYVAEGVLSNANICYHSANSHFLGWLKRYTDLDYSGSPPPKKEGYSEALEAIYSSLQSGASRYSLCLTKMNRAKVLCSEKFITTKRDSGTSALDFVNSFDEEGDMNA